MNKQKILKYLLEKNLDYAFIYKNSTDSTNNDAKKTECDKNVLIAADSQTAGRGRYGRGFYSRNNKGLYFTLKINNPVFESVGADGNPPENTGRLPSSSTFFPLIAALAVCRAAADVCCIDLSIKWPNDLLYKSGADTKYKKVCGILTEASIPGIICRGRAPARPAGIEPTYNQNRGTRRGAFPTNAAASEIPQQISYIIAGIGINVNHDITDFPEELKDTASSLKIISGKKHSRADILCATVDYFDQFLRMPRELLLEEYKSRLVLETDITFTLDGKIVKGRAKDINAGGNLIAECENGEEMIIQSGEINFI